MTQTAKKKPAELSDSLLSHRPRKGDAKPQTEANAATPERPKTESAPKKAPAPKKPAAAAAEYVPLDRRRRRAKATSRNTEQVSMRVRPDVLERFYDYIDDRDMTLAQGLEALLDEAGR